MGMQAKGGADESPSDRGSQIVNGKGRFIRDAKKKANGADDGAILIAEKTRWEGGDARQKWEGKSKGENASPGEG